MDIEEHIYTKLVPAYTNNLKENKMNYTNTNKIGSTESAIKNIKEGNFIVGSFDGTNFSISYQPAVHSTSAAARQECDRLARANPGKMYVFLQLKGAELVPQTPRMSI